MAEIMIKGYLCDRCNHKWVPISEKHLEYVPNVKAPYWNTKRKLEKKT